MLTSFWIPDKTPHSVNTAKCSPYCSTAELEFSLLLEDIERDLPALRVTDVLHCEALLEGEATGRVKMLEQTKTKVVLFHPITDENPSKYCQQNSCVQVSIFSSKCAEVRSYLLMLLPTPFLLLEPQERATKFHG